MINPNSENDILQLRESMDWSRRKLDVFREKRYKAIQQYIGYHYSDEMKDRVPMNLIALSISIFLRKLTGGTPRARISTRHQNLKPQAADLELAVTHLVEEIKLRPTLARVALEALFSIGVVKVGLEQGGRVEDVEMEGVYHDIGQTYIDLVPLTEWVHDMSASVYEKVAFAGNLYALPLDEVKDSERFDKTLRHKLTATDDEDATNRSKDEDPAALSQGSEGRQEKMRKTVRLWDLWLPMEKKLITLPFGGPEPNKALRVIDWEGPEGGPYHVLGFHDVPENIMPLPPVALWRDFHETANVLFRKLKRQAERQKDILGVPVANVDDGIKVVNAGDGEAIPMQSPERMKEYSWGGPNAQNMAFMLQVKDLHSWMAGNLELLGGLGPMSETLGQDQMLSASSSELIQHMQDRMVAFDTGVMQDAASYMYHDPLLDLPLVKPIPGTNLNIEVRFKAEDLEEADFLQMNFTIEPYSIRPQSPSQKLQVVASIFERFIGPYYQLMEAQGVTVNWADFFKLVGKLANAEEINDFLTFGGVPSSLPERGPIGDEPRMPAQTTRTNVRVNRPGTTRQGKDQAMIANLMGMGQQGSEAAAMARPVT